MGWFTKKAPVEEKSFDFSAWSALVDDGQRTAAGIFTSPTTALKCGALAAALRVRVETLGSCGIQLFRRGPDNERSRADDHPLYQVLRRPNAWTSASEFTMQLESDVLLEGSGFAFANRVRGTIVELIRLDPLTVQVKHNPQTQEPVYEVTGPGGAIQRYDWRDILHIRGSIDLANRFNARPLSVVRQASETIGLTLALERHAAKILGAGARPSGVISTNGKKLDDTGIARLQRAWRGSHSGEAAGGTAVLEDGHTFTPISFSSVDLQFSEMRIFQSVEIGRWLGVPPPLVFELGRATFANSESMSQAFLTYTLLGRTKLWQGAVDRLLTEPEQLELYSEFQTDSLVRADLQARFAAYAQACGGPWMVPDEIRALDNLGKIADGDKLRPPANAAGVTATPPAKTKPGLAVVA